MITGDQIKQWFDIGVESNASHLIVVCDTFDYTYFPVWVPFEVNIREAVATYNSEEKMLRVMEVYKVWLGWEAQSEGRVYNL